MILRLERFDVQSQKPADARWIISIRELNGNCMTYAEIMAESTSGLIQTYRLAGDEAVQGCIISRLLVNPLGKQFDIWGLAGKGFIKNIEAVSAAVTYRAKQEGCTQITGHVLRHGLERVYQKIAGKPESIRYVKEI